MMLFGESNNDGHSTTTVLLTALGGLISTIATALTTAWVMLRKGSADVHKQEVDTHAKEVEVDVEEARERTKLRQDEEAWAVKEARQMYRELKKQTDSLWQEARDCHLRLATYIARDRERESRIRDLEDRLGISRPTAPASEADLDLDTWADHVRSDARQRHEDEKKAKGSEHVGD
jgi:hypothetical protein